MTNVEELEMPEFDFTDPVVVANPQAAARKLAKDHWIARTGSGYALLRWDDCKKINRDKRFRTPEGLGLSSVGITGGIAFEWASGTVLGLDGADHERIRRLAQPGFAPKQLDELRPAARELFSEILDEALPKGHGEAADVCMSYSVRMICRLLGWPEEDWRRILAWSDAAIEVASLAVGPDELAPIEEALVEMRAYTSAKLEEMRGSSEAKGFAAAIISYEEEGDRLTTVELLNLFETLLVAGSDTTKSALTTALLLFAKHPEQWQKILDDQELIPSAVEEILRFRAPTMGTARVAREDVEYNDVVFPAGTFVSAVQAAANFDPDAYEAPVEFEVDRFAGARRSPKPTHLSFGFGVHVCIGNFLARMELQEALKLLAERVEAFRIDPSDTRGVEWGSPFGVHSPTWLPLEWDLRVQAAVA
jgi:cytochrome P450